MAGMPMEYAIEQGSAGVDRGQIASLSVLLLAKLAAVGTVELAEHSGPGRKRMLQKPTP